MSSSPSERARLVKKLALEAGFDEVGIAAVPPPPDPEFPRLQDWLGRGRHGTMRYMARDPERRGDPGRVLPGARSMVSVALDYWDPAGEKPYPTGAGKIARYARGRDYHRVFEQRLETLMERVVETYPGTAARSYVDTGPVMEKLWAERAGLGWRGKHTNLVSRGRGSWLLLGEILLDLELEPDSGGDDYCGTCSACIEACPTRAITAPYQLDATLCISYLTIEYRGSIPKPLRPYLGDRVFGCDDCLEVCPWNRFARESREAGFRPRPELIAPLLADLVRLDEAGFLRRFAGTAVMRAKREGLARNACVALGNTGNEAAAQPLEEALGDPSPLVREHAAWALGRIPGAAARRALEGAYRTEADPGVRTTLRESLESGA